MSLIYDYIKKGIVDPAKLPHAEIAAINDYLRQRGAEALLLACTELPVAYNIMGLEDATCVDPTGVLAAAAIRKAGAPVRPGMQL